MSGCARVEVGRERASDLGQPVAPVDHVRAGANAPGVDGLRPVATAGTITDIRSTASSSFDGLSVNLNYFNPQRRVFGAPVELVGLDPQLQTVVGEGVASLGPPRRRPMRQVVVHPASRVEAIRLEVVHEVRCVRFESR